MATQRFGGSFAPPLSDEQLARYCDLASQVEDRQCAGYMLDLAKMLQVFRETGESTQSGTPHQSGRGTIVPLEEAEIERIWDVVPWSEECDVMGQAFDRLPTGTVLVPDPEDPGYYKTIVVDQVAYENRNAAFHLLWFARELTLDREPITSDKL